MHSPLVGYLEKKIKEIQINPNAFNRSLIQEQKGYQNLSKNLSI
jgi:hypothetical protein